MKKTKLNYLKTRKILLIEQRELLLKRITINKRLREIKSELNSWDTYIINTN